MIKKNESKFVVTDSKISKAKHMKETKQFKAFRNTLNESEYKETLTGYPNRSLDTDVGAFKFNAQFIANANAMLNALSKYSYLSTTDALVKIRARLNVLLLDFPWTPRVWSGYAQVPPAAPGENSSVVGVFTLPLTRFGRVDGYDALTGGIRFDGRAGSQDGFQEFTLTVKVELGDDSMYRVTAFVSPKEEPVMAEEGVEVDGDTIDEMAQTPARAKETKKELKSLNRIRNRRWKEYQRNQQDDRWGTEEHWKSTDKFATAQRKLQKTHDQAREEERDSKTLYGKGGKILKKPVKEEIEQIEEMAQTPARVKEMQGKLDTAASKIRNKVGDQPAAKKKYNSILSKDRNEFFAKKMYGKGGKEVKEELVGGQKKLDANKNKKLDSQDFKLLRSKKSVKEEIEIDEGMGGKIAKKAKRFGQTVSGKLGLRGRGEGGSKTLTAHIQTNMTPSEKLSALKQNRINSKSVKEDVTTEFTTGLPIMDPALGSNIADQSGKGTKRIKKTVDEAATKKPIKKPSPNTGASNEIGKRHAIKDRLNKYGMRW